MKKIVLGFVCAATLLPVVALAEDGSTGGVGLEGFMDRYREPDTNVDVTTTTTYGSLTGYYAYEQSGIFGALDGRISYGTADYKSPSGTMSGSPEWEYEVRARLGYDMPLWGGSLTPYTGVGVRYYTDEGKGRYTNTFAGAYDRRIFQNYIPFGARYTYVTEGGWNVSPMLEYDHLIYGNVNSRLGNVNSFYDNITNKQTKGYGIRGELMIGKSLQHFSWQFGPFVRYWNVDDSDTTYDRHGIGWLEPQNTRRQIGAALRLQW